MRIKSITLHRYRIFKERETIDLAPINIIIGKNGSGKSIISRLPLLLAVGISGQAEGPLDLSAGGVTHAASFSDLVNLRGILPFTLGFEVEGEEGRFRFETTMQYMRESKSLAVSKFLLIQNETTRFLAVVDGEEQLEKAQPIFNIIGEGINEQKLFLGFSGLFPIIEGFERRISEEISTILGFFQKALPLPSYLGPFRVEPAYATKMPNQNIRDLGPRGERALEILADDRLRHGGQLTKSVSEWYTLSMGQSVDIDVSGEQPRAYVADAQSGFQVGLPDTGAGFAQSLPIVVQHLAYRSGRIKAPMLVVEQPELHLHPAAHGELADLVIQSALGAEGSWAPATCIVETHSEQFIMRVRRRLVELQRSSLAKLWSLGHLDALEDDVEVDPLRVISFDAKGNPDSWPVGVFEETLGDLAAMRKSARERGL